MDFIDVQGEDPTALPRPAFDLRRNLALPRHGLCHAPWVSLHLLADGEVRPCRFGGALLGLMGFVDDELGVVMWAGGAAYGVLAAIQFPMAALHLFTGVRLRSGGGGLILVLAALAVCLVQLVFALYCFPFELALMIYGGVVLMDPDVRAHLDGP